MAGNNKSEFNRAVKILYILNYLVILMIFLSLWTAINHPRYLHVLKHIFKK